MFTPFWNVPHRTVRTLLGLSMQGSQERKVAILDLRWGQDPILLTNRAWISIFGLTLLGDEVRIEDGDFPANYDHVAYMKSILKDPAVLDKQNESITAGHLKRDPRLLNWIISRVIRPRAGGFSRI